MNSNIKIITNHNHKIINNIERLIVDFQNTNNFYFPIRNQFEFHIPKNFELEFFNLSDKIFSHTISNNEQLKHNAITILPKDVNFIKFIVLFRKNIFDDYEYISTVTHELTHLADYIDYFSDKGNVYNGNVIFDEFYFWTEFNAKRKGIKKFLEEIEKLGYSISLEEASKIFISELEETNSINNKIYLLVHFFARLSLFDKERKLCFDECVFPKNYLINLFGKEVILLYEILYDINNYVQFKEKKTNLSLILNKIKKV